MIRSMTGYGKKDVASDNAGVTVEIRSVNHRFLEVAVRVPRSLAQLEDPIRKAVQQRCLRGRVDVSVSVHAAGGSLKTVQIDQALAKQYHGALKKLQKSLGLKGTIDISLLAGFRDIVSITDEPVDTEHLGKTVLRALGVALTDLEKMRKREGDALAKDLISHLDAIRTAKSTVAERAPELAANVFGRMKGRIEALLQAEIPDPARLQQELALYADRSDISEELVRLESHMLQFDQTLRSKESVGKTLEFLLQEMGREVNTIGSKANDADIAALVVRMKAELEKLREQVQNVE
ncbi:MAG TPA: YicC family protein [Nitrospira sp.]|nr:YicC family protein [Nitrospira sp.]MBS0173441.1 YicC family protein [Nitrospira sp.]MBX3336270.1 YicC family protein [Nitrospira sp.]MCW5780697.1 YicC family protein [Nitrospira sp.]HNI68062.1 YicC family protein [Nitrospira sp.]